MQSDRRKFLKQTFASAATMSAIPMLPGELGCSFGNSSVYREIIVKPENHRQPHHSVRFQVFVPYGTQLVSDVVNRTETAMTQDHCFLATELALKFKKWL